MSYCGTTVVKHPVYHVNWWVDQYWSDNQGDFVYIWLRPATD